MMRKVERFRYEGKLYTRAQAREFGRTVLTDDGSQLLVITPSGHSFWMDTVFVEGNGDERMSRTDVGERERKIAESTQELEHFGWSVDFEVDSDCDGNPEWYARFTDPFGTEYKEYCSSRDALEVLVMEYEKKAFREFVV